MIGMPFDPEPEPIPEEDRPVIRVVAGKLDLIATEAELALINARLPIFQRGSALVRPVLMEVAASKGRTIMAAGLSQMTLPAMVDRLCRVTSWEKYDARSKGWRAIDPPSPVAATMLSRVGEWRFRPVAGIITTPTLRPDGSLLLEPGYDTRTRLYHALDTSIDIHPYVPTHPTRADAERALQTLQHILAGFPTVTEVDAAVALSGMISPVARGAIGAVPMHAFRASTAGTGKSYLVDVISTTTTGRPCPSSTVAKTEEETEKRLGGLLIAAFPLICLDNINGELGGDLLCQAIERPIVQIRPLGSSEIIEIETRSCIYATGNALRVRGDMTRRTLVADLDAGVERPELRAFDFDPVDEVLQDRGKYIGACLTIVLAHAEAGFPGADNLPPLGSFTDWSRYVRAALVWLGCADPCLSMETAREDDPELAELNEMLEAWAAEFGTVGAFTTAECIEMINQRYADAEERGAFQHPRMRDILMRWSGGKGADARRIGNTLRGKEGRISRRMKLRKAGTASGGTVRWQVVTT